MNQRENVVSCLSRRSLASVLLAWLCLVPGCGIDVGNAGKPQPVVPTLSLANTVSLQYDESIGAALDGAEADREATAMALQPADKLGLGKSECVENVADGSITLSQSEEGTFSRDFGRGSRRKNQTDALALERTLSLKTNGVKLSCLSTKPNIPWLQVSALDISTEFAKKRSRVVKLAGSGALLEESSLESSGQRTQSIVKLSQSLQEISLRKTVSFRSSATRVKAGETVSSSLSTSESDPIVIETVRSRTQGRTATIKSGTVTATLEGGRRTVLVYQNLVLTPGTLCHPLSGTIKGEVYADAVATVAESTFQMVFSSEGALLRLADGTEEDLELENCQL